jgi:hypothetical protein
MRGGAALAKEADIGYAFRGNKGSGAILFGTIIALPLREGKWATMYR